jgi:hypothetical protein
MSFSLLLNIAALASAIACSAIYYFADGNKDASLWAAIAGLFTAADLAARFA